MLQQVQAVAQAALLLSPYNPEDQTVLEVAMVGQRMSLRISGKFQQESHKADQYNSGVNLCPFLERTSYHLKSSSCVLEQMNRPITGHK